MRATKLQLLDVHLNLFDGEGSAPAASGQETGSSEEVANPTSDKPAKVLYGKQEDENLTDDKASKDKADPSVKFEELIKGEFKDPFNKRVQDIINKRFKDVKGLEKKVSEYESITEILQHKYGTDDIEQIRSQVEREVIEELAYQNDMSPENYKKIMNADKIEKQQRQSEAERQRQEQVSMAVQKWAMQADAYRLENPDFDFNESMKNDTFIDLLKSNVPVKAAYEILNIDKIKDQIRKEVETKTAASIQSKKSRPSEAGLKNQSGIIVKSDVSSLTQADREDIARRVNSGERITF